ncbi:MAG: glucose-1-phosphate adenylyltransferase [Parasphingorhabdus sp.]
MNDNIHDDRYISKLTKDSVALIMAGGRGSRLKNLTQWRAKPAVYFGGKFRIIDFPLSNCVNSGIRRVGVLTQYKAHSLIRHIVRGWTHFKSELGEFVDILPASQRMSDDWYVGTADSIYQNRDIINVYKPKYVIILAGDHIYKMDYGPMLAAHVQSGASLTVGCIEVPLKEATAFGVMAVDDAWRITGFAEKPAIPAHIPGNPDEALASMGIYVFDREFLFQVLEEDANTAGSSRDFGKDIVPKLVENSNVLAYPFRDLETNERAYWRDVGTIDSFWEANLELVGIDPELNLYDDDWPIWTYQVQLPPAKFVHDDDDRRGVAIQSMVSGGCIVSGAEVRNSLLFSSVEIHSYSKIDQSVILPEVNIGSSCRIKRAVIDRNCNIPDGTIIGENETDDRRRFYVSEGGIVLVTPDMLEQEFPQ